jgi:hypothetical protein
MLLPLLVVPAISALTRAPEPEVVTAAFGAQERDAGGLVSDV